MLRDMLASFAGIKLAKSVYSEAVQGLVAIGAAIASNCETCFTYHLVEAQKLGVSKKDIARAVGMAAGVKRVPARSIIKYAQTFLNGIVDNVQPSSCCGPGNVDDGNQKPCC